MMDSYRMLIAGGGTGGHLFPGMAVAEEFLRRAQSNRVLFVGTAAGIEAKKLPAAGYDFAAIRSQGIAGKGLAAKLKGLAILPLSVLDAGRVIRNFKPQVALGVGGYVSGPTLLAARLLGVPAAIQEQNTVPGFTNRILGLFVQKVFLSFEPARAWFERAERQGRIATPGNPVRRQIVDSLLQGDAAKKSASAGGDQVRLFVVGGSQGAHGLNLLVLAAVAALAAEDRARLSVRHQTGDKDFEAVSARYRELKIEAQVEPFIQDMAPAYLAADLAVSRSGAGAVAELALAGLPAILVPYPFAASDHQAKNAEVLVAAGAAKMLREAVTDGAGLAQVLSELINDPAKRREMAKRAAESARPRAAAEIVDGCLELVKEK